MTIENQLERLNRNLEALIKTLQQDVNPVVQPPAQAAGAPQMGMPPQAPAQAPIAPPAAAPGFPPMAAPGTAPAPGAVPPTGAPSVPSAAAPQAPTPAIPAAPQAPAAPAAPPAPQPDNVVPMQPAAPTGPAMSRQQLNSELMAVVAQLGGGQAAAAQVMGVLTEKYNAASLQSIPEEQFPAVLADVKALVGG